MGCAASPRVRRDSDRGRNGVLAGRRPRIGRAGESRRRSPPSPHASGGLPCRRVTAAVRSSSEGSSSGSWPWPLRAEEAPPARPIAAKEAIAPAAPALPAEVVAAMQEGRFAEALAALDALDAEGRSRPRTGPTRPDPRDRRAAGGQARRGPRRPWPGPSQEAPAGALGGQAPVRAGRRRAGRRPLRRGRGAGPRRGRGAPGRRPQGPPRRGLPRLRRAACSSPTSPIVPPDPEGAYALLGQARGLAKGEALRARLLFAMARASQAAGNHARAIEDFQAYLKEYPEGRRPRRRPAPPGRGAAGRRPGRSPARLTWTDLARDLEKAGRPRTPPTLRARALFGIAATYGIPAPARRHAAEPRRRRAAAVPGRRTRPTPRPSGPPTRSARRTSPGARASRRSRR